MKSWNFRRSAVAQSEQPRERIDLRTPRNAYYDTVSSVFKK